MNIVQILCEVFVNYVKRLLNKINAENFSSALHAILSSLGSSDMSAWTFSLHRYILMFCPVRKLL